MVDTGDNEFLRFFSDTSFLVQNVRSFNSSDLSFATTKHKLKVMLSSNADFFLLSEIKLCNNNIARKIRNFLKLNNYDLFVNSNSRARGVAIIIRSGLYDTAETIFECPNGNSLILNFTKGAVKWTFWGAYLDSTDNLAYFRETARKARTGFPLFLGGDLNCVTDCEPDPRLNMDLHNRLGVPNRKISGAMLEVMNELNLVDAFRALNGEKQAFSFTSSNGASRIDHLLVPRQLKNSLVRCSYKKLSNHFDHSGLFESSKESKKEKNTE